MKLRSEVFVLLMKPPSERAAVIDGHIGVMEGQVLLWDIFPAPFDSHLDEIQRPLEVFSHWGGVVVDESESHVEFTEQPRRLQWPLILESNRGEIGDSNPSRNCGSVAINKLQYLHVSAVGKICGHPGEGDVDRVV